MPATPERLVSRRLRRYGSWQNAWEIVLLTYEERLIRRRVLTLVHGDTLLVDLPEVVSVNSRDAFEAEDGRLVEVLAAEEALAEIRAEPAELTRIAWHVGNRHTPCQIEPGRLLIRRDHVIEDMLARLGATVTHVTEPFTPEGGAYGTGRTMGHSHGPGHAHGHSHD